MTYSDILKPYFYEGKHIFSAGKFGDVILIQSTQETHPLDYPQQLNVVLQNYSNAAIDDEILVIFDMTNYGSDNFEMIYNKKTTSLKIKLKVIHP